MLQRYEYLVQKDKLLSEIKSIHFSDLVMFNPYLLIDAGLREFHANRNMDEDEKKLSEEEVLVKEAKIIDQALRAGTLRDPLSKPPSKIPYPDEIEGRPYR